MDPSQREASQRPRRSRSAPPPEDLELTFVAPRLAGEEVPRFRGEHAPLATLGAELRRARAGQDKEEAARVYARLGRLLARRSVECRETIGLMEKSLELLPDADLAGDLARAWEGVGDYVRAATLLTSVMERAPGKDAARLWLDVARLFAHSGRIPQTLQALHRALGVDSELPEAHEMLGALGFWADIPEAEASSAYLSAAELRARRGEAATAFENLLRAFEIDPASEDAAAALSEELERRGRQGAADDIVREHLRHGSAARRAAFHERRFYECLAESRHDQALETALEAELDLEIDPKKLLAALEDRAARPVDFEGFLLHLASTGLLGDSTSYAAWLTALVDLHRFDWGVATVQQVAARLEATFGVAPDTAPVAADAAHRMRGQLTTATNLEEVRVLRIQIGRSEAARGAWGEAFEALEPLLDAPHLTMHDAALLVLVAGRSRSAVGRARALAALGRALPSAAASVTLAVASEALLSLGHLKAAALSSSEAVDLDPSFPRAIAAQAFVALRYPEAASAGQLESSLSVLVARGQACLLLARSALDHGSARLSLSWAHRYIQLRPADPQAVRQLLSAVARAGDAERMVEELTFVLAQPMPYVEVAEDVADALRALADLSEEAAVRAGKLVLAHFGIRFGECREALEDVAERTGSAELGAELLERRLVLAPADERGALLLQLGRYRAAIGDATSAARAFRRALSSGAPAAEVQAGLTEILSTAEPDAVLAVLEARVDSLLLLSPDDFAARAEVLWRLGAARWDLAQDPEGALRAWMSAVDLDPVLGPERLGRYLDVLAGPDEAAVQLERATQSTDDVNKQARLLGQSARLLLLRKQNDDAFRLAKSALERAPLLTENLAIAERAVSAERLGELEALYRSVAAAALGRYGERAVHYRAARLLEKRGRMAAALEHATEAFEAVPTEGVTFVTMARLADATGNIEPALAALGRVAAGAGAEGGIRWQERARALSSRSEGGGVRQRLDVLFRALSLRAEEETVRAITQAMGELGEATADERRAHAGRFETIARVALGEATGAHGAALLVSLGVAALSAFELFELGQEALLAAVALNIEIPEYEALGAHLAVLGKNPESALLLLSAVEQRADEGLVLGKELAIVLGDVANLLGAPARRAELLVRSASDFPDDEALTSLARKAALDAGREDLLDIIEDLLPIPERAEAVLSRLPSLGVDDGLVALSAIEPSALGPELRARVLLSLAERQEAIGRVRAAEASYRDLYELEPKNLTALRGLARAAEKLSDHEELVRLLRAESELSSVDEARQLALRRARILDLDLGRPAEARALLEQALEPGEDAALLRALGRNVESSGDSARAAEVWLRAARAEGDQTLVDEALIAAARCLLASGDERRALEALGRASDLGIEGRKLEFELGKRLGDREAEYAAVVALARHFADHPELSAEYNYQAARLSLGRGDVVAAHDFAQKVGSSGASGAAARLLSCQLKVRARPPVTRRHGEELLEGLKDTDGVQGASQREIRYYLLAEATALTEGLGKARELLEAAIVELGMRPLLAAALAARLSDDAERALSLYEAAIGGELQGLKRDGDLLLDAALIARSMGDLPRARAFASAVADDDPRRVDAARELEAIAVEMARSERKEREERARDERARQQQAALERAREEQIMKERAEEQAEKERASDEGAAKAELRTEPSALERAREEARAEEARARAEAVQRAREERLHNPEETSRHSAGRSRPLARMFTEAERAAVESGVGVRPEGSELSPVVDSAERERASRQLDDPTADARRTGETHRSMPAPSFNPDQDRGVEQSQARASISSVAPSSAPVESPRARSPSTVALEDELAQAFETGDVEAGFRLLEHLTKDRARSRDAVVVAGHLAARAPGDARALRALSEAAARDGNESLAASVRHVLGSFGAGPVEAPPSASLLEPHPTAAQRMLSRGTRSPALEALGLLWESASALFKREPQAYGLSGIQRVQLTAPTPLGTVYRNVARMLGSTRTSLFRTGTGSAIAMNVALLVPPGLVVEGEIHEVGPEFAFHFGAMLAAASPELVLVYGLEPEALEELLSAVVAAFGPAARSPDPPSRGSGTTRLSALLWEAVPVRIQRRLSQLAAETDAFTVSRVHEAARPVLRRAGLLSCGDLAVAVGETAAQIGVAPPTTLAELAALAEQSGDIADLVGLALSTEYAEVRFRGVR